MGRHGATADVIIANRVQPRPERAHPAGVYAAGPVTRDDIDGSGDVVPGQGMSNRLLYRSPPLVPFTCAPVQDGHDAGLGLHEPAKEHLTE